MAYSTITDMEKRLPRPKIDELSKPDDPGVIVGDCIEEADGIIDDHNTSTWGTASKKGCSRALAIEMLFARHGTGKMPKNLADQAQFWRDRLSIVGLRSASAWHAVAFDPAMDETDEELEQLRTRDP